MGWNLIKTNILFLFIIFFNKINNIINKKLSKLYSRIKKIFKHILVIYIDFNYFLEKGILLYYL